MEAFLIGLVKIVFINIVLSGDNAVVIAMACRNLPVRLQKKAIFWGSFGAILLRAILTFVTVWLLKIKFVQLIGAILLFYIAIKLLKKDDGEEKHGAKGEGIAAAIKTIVVADLVMSLDNVVAIAAAAKGDYLLISIGLAVSIPIIIWCSQLLMKLMQRFPFIITIGAGLLGYTAGEMLLRDEAAAQIIEPLIPAASLLVPVAGILIVLAGGKLLYRTHTSAH